MDAISHSVIDGPMNFVASGWNAVGQATGLFGKAKAARDAADAEATKGDNFMMRIWNKLRVENLAEKMTKGDYGPDDSAKR